MSEPNNDENKKQGDNSQALIAEVRGVRWLELVIAFLMLTLGAGVGYQVTQTGKALEQQNKIQIDMADIRGTLRGMSDMRMEFNSLKDSQTKALNDLDKRLSKFEK